jgi:hypothetical protein
MIAKKKQVEVHSSVKASTGYGGKFGVQTDRVDKVCSIFIIDFLHVLKDIFHLDQKLEIKKLLVKLSEIFIEILDSI